MFPSPKYHNSLALTLTLHSHKCHNNQASILTNHNLNNHSLTLIPLRFNSLKLQLLLALFNPNRLQTKELTVIKDNAYVQAQDYKI
jgi:hypothetical protein